MSRKKDSDLLILGLLALAFLGKGPFAGPPSPMDMGSPTSRPMDMPSSGRSSDGSPSGSGTNDKNQSNSNKNMGMGGGVPDKGSPMTPPMGPPMVTPMYVPPMDNAGVKASEAQIKTIMGGGGIMEGSGLFLQTNLPHPSGDPFSAVTTTVFNPKTGKYDTYTNNSDLFATPEQKNAQPMSIMEMAKQVMPMMGIMDIPVKASPPPAMTPPLMGLFDLSALTSKDVYRSLIMQSPSMTSGQVGSEFVRNPLPQMPSILQGLENFGQASLNKLLESGQSLTGLFSNLKGVFPFFGSPSPVTPIEVPLVA